MNEDQLGKLFDELFDPDRRAGFIGFETEVFDAWTEHVRALERGEVVYDSALELVARLILEKRVKHPQWLWDYYKKLVESWPGSK